MLGYFFLFENHGSPLAAIKDLMKPLNQEILLKQWMNYGGNLAFYSFVAASPREISARPLRIIYQNSITPGKATSVVSK